MKKKAPVIKASALSALSDRDRKLLMLFPLIFVFVGIAIGAILYSRSIDVIEQQAAAHRAALDYLAQSAPEYLDKQSRAQSTKSHKKMDDEVLKNNDIKLTSFVAEHAAAAQITITSYDEDEMPFGGTSKTAVGPIITERQLRIEIREAEMTKLLDLLDRIEKSTEPVFIKRLDIRDVRKKGEVRAIVTVSTFVQKEKAT